MKTKRIAVMVGSLCAIILFVALVLAMLRTPTHIPGAQRFDHAEFLLEGQADSWHEVTLPDNWDMRLPGRGGYGLYRVHVGLTRLPQELWGIYLPLLSFNAEVYVNGAITGSGGSMVEPVSRHWNLPLYFQIAPQLLKLGDNDIRVRLRGFPNGRTSLSPVFVGPDAVLSPAYRARYLHSHELNVGAFAVNMALGLILLVWWRASRDVGLLWFAAGSLISCIYILDSFWIDPPFSRFDWRWITHVAIAWSISCYYLFMLHMLEHRVRWPERILIGYVAIGALLLGFTDSAHQLPFALAIHLGSLIIMMHLIWISGAGWVKQGNRLHLSLGICMAVVAAFGFADWIPVAFHVEKDAPYVYYLGPVAFSFAVSLALLTRFLNALAAERDFAKNMRVSLREQEEQLQAQHQRIAALKRERAVTDERGRIVRELHDGLGSHLMGALSVSEQQGSSVNAYIQHALDELRIIMDSLDTETDVLTMLGMLRQRLEPGLKQAGVTLKWEVHGKPDGMNDGAEASLHVMRIVQEAIANAVRHGKAKYIVLHTDESGFFIADDGCGFQADEIQRGRGLNNMAWRASQLGARFEIEPTSTGSKISVQFTSG